MRGLSAVVVVLLALAACSGGGAPQGLGPSSASPQPSTRTGGSPGEANRAARPHLVGTAASGLAVPWGVGFLPDGTALVTERSAATVLAVDDGSVRTVGKVAQADPAGEGGLLGLAVSPTFGRDSLVYVYVTTSTDNRVLSMSYDGQRLGRPHTILSGIPKGLIHNGGRLAFGPDGYLFVSTGETGDSSLAQDPASLGGKILRVTQDGEPAPGNPDSGSPVWTLGHRNVEGLAFDPRHRLWATEFGDSTWDELNLVEKGRNYGWPEVEGSSSGSRYRNPYVQWHTDQASSSGLAFLDGSLWAGSLRGQRLWRIPLTRAGTARPQDYFVGRFGRLRTVVAAPDGNLWVTTSNKDGRGDPGPHDDRILVISPG